jgi:uncharacterized membrane protein
MAHSHAHNHDAEHELEIPSGLRRRLNLSIVPVVILVAIGMAALWPSGHGPDLHQFLGGDEHLVRGTVVGAQTSDCLGSPEGAGNFCQHVTVHLDGGRDRGRNIQLEAGGPDGSPRLHGGDHIYVGHSDAGGERQYYFSDFDRDRPLVLLVVLFVGAAVVLGRASGVRALLALVASLLALVWFVIPSVLHHHSPIAVAIVGSAFIMLVVLYVTGGFNTQSTVAVLGTMVSLALIAALAWAFVEATKLTGLADEDALFLTAAGGRINMQGLLLGGIIIGSLGVLDDMTVTQVSAVWELRRANDRYSARGLYRAAERVGRDHIASTINTLVLAYSGASLPLLIYFTQSSQPLRHTLTNETVAVEIVRTLVGSIGLIASVPITTALAAYVVTRSSGADEPPAPRLGLAARFNRRLTRLNDRARRGLRTNVPPDHRSRTPDPWQPPKQEREFREP